MVLINGVKYACERCIRGHRVTTCNHTDQPLMMIKPKGRPSTTCDHCKELRKNKNANPSGACTCGRLEKKRLAQKAKEEARAKAREEKKIKDCKCVNDENCKCHGTRRSIRKRSSGITLKKDSGSIHTNEDHLMSPISIDSRNNFSIGGGNNNNISEASLRDHELNGKVSKEYHHVPSLHSISSFQSTRSLDNNFSIPQSPPLVSAHYNSSYSANGKNNQANNNSNNSNNNNNNNNSSNISSNMNHSSSFVNWDNSSITSSETHLQPEKNTSVGLDPLQNTKRISSLTRARVGEVTIPLEEYVPSSIDGVGKVNDTNSLSQDWSFDNNPSSSNLNSSYSNISAMNSNNNTNTHNGLLDMFLDSSSIPALSRANLLLQEKNNLLKDEINNNSTPANSANNNINSNYTSNGFHAGQDALHHYSIKNHFNNNNANASTNVISKSHSSSNFNAPNNLINNNAKGSFWIDSSNIDQSETFSADNESVRSVEVLSLTPSFMDIPDRSSSFQHIHNQNHPHHPQSNLQRQSLDSERLKQRSSSIHRNHRYPQSSYVGQSVHNVRSQPITVNPSMVSNVDDTISLNSLQSPTSSLHENGFMSASTDYFQGPKQVSDRLKSPRSLSNTENVTISQQSRLPSHQQQQYTSQSRQSSHYQKLSENNKEQASQLFTDLGLTLDSDQFLGLSTADQSQYEDPMRKNQRENNNPLSFANSMIKSETSPASSNQAASPPSQLLNEKNYADLDSFMSIL
ncbi:hypothetical protein HG535_0H01720 [Zygotorulaspora mrakii]|uniref:Copper-fist domain-containing protein n=1 Tax=Zygotorulaspora mrakii TaxID=42260 RepID=A0A7H9B844_ZYGMR|nr:uncharacterized protein HG535_0H01720 [Zygotorulaspora mrakii]QLG74845.1 hypothetical protein HG535_0H01720 [Zygotorulaspora mrakii]